MTSAHLISVTYLSTKGKDVRSRNREKKVVPKDARRTVSVLCDNRGEQNKHAFLPTYMSERTTSPKALT